MVRHEASLVFELVEENVLAVDPDVRILDLSVDGNLSLYLVSRIVFCDSELGSTWDVDELGRAAGFNIAVNVLDDMVAFAHDHMVDVESLRVSVADLHLPGARAA